MNKSTAQAAPEGITTPPESPHPSWCDRVHCDVDSTETYHSSAPVELKTGTGVIELALVRSDEHAHPELWGRAPELCMIVESGPLGELGEVHIDLSDVPELLALFTQQYAAGAAAEQMVARHEPGHMAAVAAVPA